MDNSLHQLNAAFDPVQDRIVLGISSRDGTEFRFWITRRYLGLLWTALGRLASEFAAARSGGDPLARDALAELAHHRAHENADFRSPWQGGSHHPLGAGPVLLAKIGVKKDREGRTTLSLLPSDGLGADIGIDESMTHLLAGLLQKAAVQAEWRLELASLTPSTSAYGEPGAGLRLH